MKKLRIHLKGKVFGFIPIDWTYSRMVTRTELEHAEWLMGMLWDIPVSVGPIKGALYATLEDIT